MLNKNKKIDDAISNISFMFNKQSDFYFDCCLKGYEDFFSKNRFFMYLKGGRVEFGFNQLIKDIIESANATKAKAFIISTENLLAKHFDAARAFRYREKFEKEKGLFTCPVYEEVENVIIKNGGLQDLVDVACCAGTNMQKLAEQFIYKALEQGLDKDYISQKIQNIISARREKELDFVKSIYVGDAGKINQKIETFIDSLSARKPTNDFGERGMFN